MRCPCRGCHDRTITCHGVCEKYQGWKKKNEDVKRWIRDQNPVVSENMLKVKNRNIRQKARGWKRTGGTKDDR